MGVRRAWLLRDPRGSDSPLSRSVLFCSPASLVRVVTRMSFTLSGNRGWSLFERRHSSSRTSSRWVAAVAWTSFRAPLLSPLTGLAVHAAVHVFLRYSKRKTRKGGKEPRSGARGAQHSAPWKILRMLSVNKGFSKDGVGGPGVFVRPWFRHSLGNAFQVVAEKPSARGEDRKRTNRHPKMCHKSKMAAAQGGEGGRCPRPSEGTLNKNKSCEIYSTEARLGA